MCKGACMSADRAGYQCAPLPPRGTWHYLDGRVVCVRCHVSFYGVPDDVARCPCCNNLLRRGRLADGTLTGRSARRLRERMRRYGQPHPDDRPPRKCGQCGAPLPPHAPPNRLYCPATPCAAEAARARARARWRTWSARERAADLPAYLARKRDTMRRHRARQKIAPPLEGEPAA